MKKSRLMTVSCVLVTVLFATTKCFCDPISDGPYIRTRPVSNASELSTALGNAIAGDDIVLADGTYSGDFTLSIDGNATNPIRIRAANPHNAILSGRLYLNGRYNIAYQLKWDGSPTSGDAIIDVNGTNCKVSRCMFINVGVSNGAHRGIVRLQPGANDCVVEYNEFWHFSQRAVCVRSVNGGALHAIVRRNYFKGNVVVPGFSGVTVGFGGDSDRGVDTRRELFGLVEYNLIEDVGGGMGNILQAKTSRIIFQFNTARNCPDAYMQIRSGQFCDFIANAMLNSGGPLLQGVGHRMIGNYNDGRASGSWRDMGPLGGDRSLKTVGDSETFSGHAWAEDCLLAGNIGILRLGGGSSNWQATRNNIVEEHNGSVVDQNATGTIYRNLTVTVPPYVILNPSDVGVNYGL